MTTQQIVDLLNEALKFEPGTIDVLTCFHMPVFSQELKDHPTIQVRCEDKEGIGKCSLSMLGILNGIAGIDGYRIWADFDDKTFLLLRFRAEKI